MGGIGPVHPVEVLTRKINGEPVTLYRPLIDKIGICFNAPDVSKNEAVAQLIAQAPKAVDDGSVYQAQAAFYKSFRYKINMNLSIGLKGQHALLQAVPKAKNTKNCFRLEFNPSAVGPSGVEWLSALLSEIVQEEFSFGHVAMTGHVRRVDVALDIVGIGMKDVLVLSKEKGKTLAYKSATSEMETAYLNHKPGRRSRIRIYDKKKQLEESGKDPIFGDRPHIRYERELGTSRPIASLHKLINPFKKLQLFAPRLMQHPEKPHHWLMFLECVRSVGKDAAIDLMPKTIGEKYDKALRNNWTPLYTPSIWNHWPDVIEDAGLLNEV